MGNIPAEGEGVEEMEANTNEQNEKGEIVGEENEEIEHIKVENFEREDYVEENKLNEQA